MGYYTAYNLSVRTVDNKSEIIDLATIDNIVSLLVEKGVIGYALDENLNCHDTVTWYDYEEDMLDISKQFPDVLFCLHGEGEESGDIWDHYFLNGKAQYCKAEINIPPFDPNRLGQVT